MLKIEIARELWDDGLKVCLPKIRKRGVAALPRMKAEFDGA